MSNGPLVPLRRHFVLAAAALTASPLVTRSTPSRASTDATRTLSFVHTHTGEALSLAYAQGGAYMRAALDRIDLFLRDFRTGEVAPIDPHLLDQLHALATITGSRTPFEVISGYRSPATNASLRAKSNGVAEHSLHVEGRAIDIRLADVPLAGLRDAAMSLQAGGVGFYPRPRFVHVDTGRVRHW